jgi:hypothetical protein
VATGLSGLRGASVTAALITPEIGDATRIRLQPLRTRPDGDEWCVGRIDTGDFVVVPPVAVAALDLLGTGHTVKEVRDRLCADHDRSVDVAGFVANLIDLGFVAAVDGRPVAGPAVASPTWPWLRPRHTRWTLTTATAVVMLVLPLCGLVAAVLVPRIAPTYHDLVWSDRGSFVLAGNAAIGWSIIFLHELAHLATARAVGVPGRFSLGTRLQFLAAQTDVSGVWAAPRRTRLTVYLAGMAMNLAIAAAALLLRLLTGPDGLLGQALAAICLMSLVLLAPQLLVFMRTDVYYVIQDLAGCRNLYADGSAYVRFCSLRAWRGVTRRRAALADPSLELCRGERRAVRAYAVILLLGTVACLAAAAFVTVPAAVTLFAGAVTGVLSGGSVAAWVDGAVTFTVVGGFWALWCRAWWRRHGRRVVAWSQRTGERHRFRRSSRGR